MAGEISDVLVEAGRFPNRNVGKVEVEPGINITQDGLVRSHNVLQLYLEQVVEGVNVLLDETFYFQKRRQEIPLVSLRVNSLGHGLALIEWFQKCVETIIACGPGSGCLHAFPLSPSSLFSATFSGSRVYFPSADLRFGSVMVRWAVRQWLLRSFYRLTRHRTSCGRDDCVLQPYTVRGRLAQWVKSSSYIGSTFEVLHTPTMLSDMRVAATRARYAELVAC